MIYLLCLITYPLPLVAAWLARLPTISPLTFLVLFYYMQFGPQCLVEPWVRLATDPSEIHSSRFVLAITLANITIALGIFISKAAVVKSPAESLSNGLLLIQHQRSLKTLIIAAILYCFAFMALDGPSLPRLRENVLYYLQSSAFSYTEIRRQLFAGSLVETVMSYTRQSTTAIIIGLLAVSATRSTGILRLTVIAIAFSVFIACSLQLNKFPVFYTLISSGLGIYLFRRGNYNLTWRGGASFALLIPILGLLLYFLYSIQYEEAIQLGYVGEDKLLSMLFYRPFMAQSDALRLWFEEFPDKTPFLGIRNIALLANLFGLQAFDVTTHIPVAFFGAEGTSFQAGFIGSGYASFGYWGIGLYGLLLGAIGVFATRLLNKIESCDLRAVYCGVMCLNMYFLCSREFSAALLSGGIAPAPLFVLAIESLRKSCLSNTTLAGPGVMR